ncbi:SDR family NAD(P)-dependent oxidoreductase [Peribacillus asahii]|uniref:SDR family NAD(P)-dependent oxidoreductase n=1 Tax=Peribacillus asahii TaxID=228899 RepID=UPI00207946A2|nr:SDR family NAD(P)-dependent oxidoreductase [Peribacillus asahii]USK68434.1 SDR family oxidoreductase [Peribacillus asahii]
MDFTGKVVLITGATGGIGKETARLFANQGAKLALVDLDSQALESLAKELELEDYLLQTADVTSEEQVENFVEQTKKKYGKIDVFFNNAGIEGKVSSIIDTSSEDLDRVLNVNIKGVFFCLKHVMAIMMEQRSGSIINSASITGLRGSIGLAPYSASKHAVLGLTKTAALESAAMGVRVNAICPGYVDTRMMQAIEEGKSPQHASLIREKAMANVPMNRYAQPEEIANLVLFLASDNASFITGNHYVIDGGMLA